MCIGDAKWVLWGDYQRNWLSVRHLGAGISSHTYRLTYYGRDTELETKYGGVEA